MGFKADTSFLKFLSMGAAGVHKTINQLKGQGFHPIELERYCGSNKIWATKVKRLRLPDLLCVNTGLRIEVRAKSDLKIRMSDAPANPDRVWDAGLRDNDLVAFIACSDSGDGPIPADTAVFFSIDSLRRSVGMSKLGPPKSASEGAERDRTWPATVPSRNGTVVSSNDKKLVVLMDPDDQRPERKQTYTLNGKSVYLSPDDRFDAGITFLAGAPQELADLPSYLGHHYDPLDELHSDSEVDRYAAVKSIPYRDDSPARTIPALEELIGQETEHRVTLEAAGSAVVLGSQLGEDTLTNFILENDDRPDLRMEAVLILTELDHSPFTHNLLNRIATDPVFHGDEIRQAAVWGIGKAGLQSYEDLLPFINDQEENVALHAIAAFGNDTPRPVIDRLIQDLINGNSRRAPAASQALSIIGNDEVIEALITSARANPTGWLTATLGRLSPDRIRNALQGDPLLDQIAPMLLLSDRDNWLAGETIQGDISFLLKQDL